MHWAVEKVWCLKYVIRDVRSPSRREERCVENIAVMGYELLFYDD
jgi:hypothetical protein